MKLHYSNRRICGLTMIDVLAVIAIVIVLAALLLPVLAASNRRSSRLNCVSNVKQVNLAFRIWEDGNNNKYPMAVSVTNGGAMEFIERGDVADCFRVMSNELSTPKVLICPMDREHVPAMDFGANFNNSHISYFVSPDAEETYPQMIMTGDDNFSTNGVQLNPGVVELSTQFSWTKKRHINIGNIGYADDSVSEVSDNGLEQAIVLSTNGTDVLTNRIAIP